jgi:hypothetical protein
MKVLYILNLFFVCCNSFFIQPSYPLIKYNHYSSISSNFNIKNKIELRKSLINIKNNNNNNNNNNNDENESLIIIKKIITNFINYMIIYIYINLLVSAINVMIINDLRNIQNNP